MSLLLIFKSFGVLGLGFVILLEIGFLPLFFLPGDTLLFSAGYFIHSGQLPIHHAVLILGFAAFLGNMMGYMFGRLFEKKIIHLVEKNEQFIKGFNKTKKFFNKYGLLTLLFGRFVPMVRSIAPFLSGVMRLHFLEFVVISLISLISAFLWVSVGLALGNFFGKKIPDMGHIVSFIMVIAVSVSLLPIIIPSIKKFFKRKNNL